MDIKQNKMQLKRKQVANYRKVCQKLSIKKNSNLYVVLDLLLSIDDDAIIFLIR